MFRNWDSFEWAMFGIVVFLIALIPIVTIGSWYQACAYSSSYSAASSAASNAALSAARTAALTTVIIAASNAGDSNSTFTSWTC